jgi:hypothetical protein
MITRPYDLSVQAADLKAANNWWRSLSLNQMKAMRDTHTAHMEWNGRQMPVYSIHELRPRAIHQIWEEEGKPLPIPPIPIPEQAQ